MLECAGKQVTGRETVWGMTINRKLREYRHVFGQIWRYGHHDKRLLVIFVGLAVLGALTEGFGVFLLVPLLETMGRSNVFASVPLLGYVSGLFEALPPDTRLLYAGALMLVVVLLRGVLQFAVEVIGYSIPYRIERRLRVRAYAKLLESNLQFADSIGAGEVYNFTVNYPVRVGIALRFVALLLSNTFVLIAYIILLTILSPLMCLAAFAYVVATTLLFKKLTSRIVHQVGRELTEADQRFNQIYYETLNGAKLIKLAGATDLVLRDVKDVVGKYERARINTVAAENMTVPFFSTVGGLLICAMVMLTGLLPAQTVSQAVGVLVIFIVMLFRILAPLSIVNIARTNIVIHLEAFHELDRLFAQADRAREHEGHVPFETFRDRIRLENVSFSYTQEGPRVLENVSLEVPKGRMIAIVGPSGSGKTTLINLIARLYRPSAGRIAIDGIDVGDLIAESWWRRLSVVTQETILTNDTVRANICFGLTSHVSEERLRQAARLAAIDEWVDEQPDKYETVLGDRGARLSGGQRQRLVLARAFVRDPDILILDEATSALDTLTERAIQRHILQMAREKKTMIIIAHRLSTVRRADTIIVMDAGRIVEVGSHNELLAERGVYWQMIESQSLDLIEDEDEDVSINVFAK